MQRTLDQIPLGLPQLTQKYDQTNGDIMESHQNTT